MYYIPIHGLPSQSTVAFLSTRINVPTEQDWTKLTRLLKYINSTKDFGIVLDADRDVCVLVYVDASYGEHADGKSHTGVIISFGRGAVFVRSGKQKIVVQRRDIDIEVDDEPVAVREHAVELEPTMRLSHWMNLCNFQQQPKQHQLQYLQNLILSLSLINRRGETHSDQPEQTGRLDSIFLIFQYVMLWYNIQLRVISPLMVNSNKS
jgi:hypothetical protein